MQLPHTLLPSPLRRASLVLAALVVSLAAVPALAQGTIVGTVTDAAGEPLPAVNVYLSGTQRGAATDAQGRFRIPEVPPGAYRLVASMLGYKAEVQEVRVEGAGEVGPIAFRLIENVSELGNVEVQGEADPRWRRRFERFKKVLLGESENAALTTIQNPQVLDLRERLGTLTATTSAPIVIDNRALGYRLYYDLHEFNAQPERIRYDGDERFEELTPADDAEAARWAVARAQAYRGSLRHLLQAFRDGRAEVEGFRFMVRKMDGEGQLVEYVGRPATNADLVRPDELPGWYTLHADGAITVFYDHEPEVPSYLRSEWFRDARSSPYAFQESILILKDGEALVDPQGNPADPFAVSASGYLAFERLGDLVPAEYVPPTDGVQSTIQTRRPPSRGSSRDR